MTAAEPTTTMCLLTPVGRGAVAVVAVTGPESVMSVGACFLARNGKPLAQQPLSRIVYGHWGSPDGEDLIVCRVAPDEVEVHCHGGAASVAEVFRSLAATGCQKISWQDWIWSRAASPIEAEAQIALAAAPTQISAAILCAQLQGALARELEAIRQELEDHKIEAANRRIAELLSWSQIGLHLTQPWQVTIAGKPNVGKSSLLNALVGYNRAIVADEPGTTRDVVSTTTAYNGWQLALSDTAGLRESQDELELAGIERARTKLAKTDLVVWVYDATEYLEFDSDRDQASLSSQQLEENWAKPCIVVVNKIDQIKEPFPQPLQCSLTCALTGAGVPELLESIVRRLAPQEPPPQQAIPFTSRQIDMLQAAQAALATGKIEEGCSLLIGLTEHSYGKHIR